MNLNLNREEFAEKLKTEHIQPFHDKYIVPITAELWENMLFLTLKSLGFDISWKCASHQVGTDLTIHKFDEHLNISAKSGTIDKDKRLKNVSSYRTTKYKTLQDKIDYITESHQDYYFCLAKKTPFVENPIYYLYIFENDNVDFTSGIWTEKYNKSNNHTGWNYETENVKAEIKKGTSDQLWINSLSKQITKEPIEIQVNL
jgi:hypothetical protein